MEIWKSTQIEELSKYEVSNLGRVRKKHDGTLVSTKPDNLGYVKCGFYVDGKTISKTVHRLVATHFIPNPDNKPEVHHIDEDKNNNRVDNLRWVTYKEHGELRSPESKMKVWETYRSNKAKRQRAR